MSKPESKTRGVSVSGGSDFVPKFKDESTYSRKIKEFYSDTEYTKEISKHVVSTKGAFKKSSYENIPVKNSIDLVSLSSKEKRLKELHPNLGKEDLEKLVLKQKNNDIEKRGCSTPKENKITHLKSNIFNVPEKNYNSNALSTATNDSINVSANKTFEGESSTTLKTNSKSKKSNWNTQLDWKNTNTELLFDKEKGGSSPPTGKKEKYVEIDEKKPNIDEMAPKLTEKFGNNETKIKKNIEQISSLHAKDFYASLKINNKERNVVAFEIDNIKDYEKFNDKDVKSIFLKNGIHLYETNSKGTFYNGNQTGKFSFKIRQNEDDPNFSEKMKKVTDTIQNKGYNLKEKSTKNDKPLGQDTTPVMKWNTPSSSQILKNKKGLTASEEPVIKTSSNLNSKE